MEFILIIAVVLLIYHKVPTYNFKIDDPLPASEYMLTITTEKVRPSEYDKKYGWRGYKYIVNFLVITGWIHVLWGWKVALLYAVCPLNVSQVAWRTGSDLYGRAVLLLCLIHFLFTLESPIFALCATIVFAIALDSNLSVLGYIPIALYYPYGWLIAIPIYMYFTGNRWKTGQKQRETVHANYGIKERKFSLTNLFNVPKCLSYYIHVMLVRCLRLGSLGFFHSFGKGTSLSRRGTLGGSGLVCLTFFAFGMTVNPFGCLWFFCMMGVFSQFIIMGQFVAERYTFLPMIGMCMILCSFLEQFHTIYFTILATIWFMVSLDYVGAYKNNEHLFSYSFSSFPEAGENPNNLGNIYLDKKQWHKAIQPFLLAIRLSKGNLWNIHANLACCYGNCGWKDKALLHTVEALKTCPLDKREELAYQRDIVAEELKQDSRKKQKFIDLGLL